MASNSKKNVVNIDDSIMTAIMTVVGNGKTWSGTMTELGTVLGRVIGRKRSEILPGSPGALRVVLNRVVNRLRSRGISVRFARTTDHTRTRFVRFTR